MAGSGESVNGVAGHDPEIIADMGQAKQAFLSVKRGAEQGVVQGERGDVVGKAEEQSSFPFHPVFHTCHRQAGRAGKGTVESEDFKGSFFHAQVTEDGLHVEAGTGSEQPAGCEALVVHEEDGHFVDRHVHVEGKALAVADGLVIETSPEQGDATVDLEAPVEAEGGQPSKLESGFGCDGIIDTVEGVLVGSDAEEGAGDDGGGLQVEIDRWVLEAG